MTNLKNLNCDKTEKKNWGKTKKNQIVTKLINHFVTKLEEKNQLWQNLKTQIMTVVLVTVAVGTFVIVTYVSKNNLTSRQPMICFLASFLPFLWCF